MFKKPEDSMWVSHLLEVKLMDKDFDIIIYSEVLSIFVFERELRNLTCVKTP